MLNKRVKFSVTLKKEEIINNLGCRSIGEPLERITRWTSGSECAPRGPCNGTGPGSCRSPCSSCWPAVWVRRCTWAGGSSWRWGTGRLQPHAVDPGSITNEVIQEWIWKRRHQRLYIRIGTYAPEGDRSPTQDVVPQPQVDSMLGLKLDSPNDTWKRERATQGSCQQLPTLIMASFMNGNQNHASKAAAKKADYAFTFFYLLLIEG